MTSGLRRSLFILSLLGVLVGVGSSYWIAEIYRGQSDLLGQADLGILVIGQYALITVFMLMAWWLTPGSTHPKTQAWILLVAILVRLLLIPAPSYTSNDVRRYLFDGRILLTGLDPYRVNHNDKRLAEIRQSWNPPAEHARYVTIYPPLALGLFAMAASFGALHAPIVWKLMVTAASLASLFFAWRLLLGLKRDRHLALVAFSPLLILESGIGVHLDGFSTLAVVLILWAWQKQYWNWCGLFIAVGILIKFMPLLLLGPLFWASGDLKRGLRIALYAVLPVLLVYGLLVLLGYEPVGSLGVFVKHWRFASPVYSYLSRLLAAHYLPVLIAILLVAGFTWIAYESWQSSPGDLRLYVLLQVVVLLPMLLSPVVFPWYLMPLVALLAVRPLFVTLVYIILMPLSYEVLGQFVCCQVWQSAEWPLLVIFVGLILGGSLDGLLNKKYYKFLKSGKKV